MVNSTYRFFFTQKCLEAWKWADQLLKENEEQPDSKTRKSIANLAKVQRLNTFSDLSLCTNHGERFGIDPDKVFAKCRFDTVITCAAEQKERHEFRERFNYIYQNITNDNTRSNTGR